MTKLMKEPDELPEGFTQPTALPVSPDEHEKWQEANRAWWNSHPMRYDWKDRIPYEEFGRDFFVEIDKRFFCAAALYLPCKKIPFDGLIDFDLLKDRDVLEIGVGSGSHAQLLAAHAKSYTGIDLTEYAVKSTAERLRIFGLTGTVLQMDGEQMQFPDHSFDFIWSWGVIHHTANTRRVLEEMRRVLRPGGEALVMVYHRTIWEYYVQGAAIALFSGQAFKPGTLHESIQRRTDGAMARYYRRAEWKRLVADLFSVREVHIYGKKTELVPIPAGRLKNILIRVIPNRLSRFITNSCGWGSLLVSRLRKQAV